MANIRSDTSRRKKDPLAGFLAPKDLLDTFFAETGTRTESDPEQVAGTRQNSFPADSSGTDSAPLRVIVGFSGGADSTALLDRLSGIPGYSVAAVHVNHGIRGDEAIRDREFCRGFCRDRRIPFFCFDADVPAMRRQGESLETAARRVRYGFFAAVMGEQGYPLLAVAHNADDNLETVLFRLCRGTGLRGLCGIPPVRAFGGGYLVRPLLGVSREEILRYLGERDLSYVTDSTNEETDAARNRLRLTVIPALRAATGDPVAGVTRMTRLLAADSRYLEAETTRLFSAGGARSPGSGQCASPVAERTAVLPGKTSACRLQSTAGFPATEQTASPLRLSRATLVGAPYPLASRAIARLMEAAGGDPSAVHVEAMLAFLRSGTAHGTFPVPGNKNAVLTVTYDDVSVTAARATEKTSPAQGAATADNSPMPADLTTEQGGAAEISDAEGIPASGRASEHAGQPDTTHKNSVIPPVGASDAGLGAPISGQAVRIRDGETCRFGRFTVRRETVRSHADSRSARADTTAPAENQAFPGRNCSPGSGVPSPGDGYGAQNNAKIYNSLLRCAVRADKINKEVFIRAKLPGDRILTCGMHKEVRRLFSAARIPPGERDSYPLLCDGDGILAIPGIAVRDGARIRPQSDVQNGEFPRGNCAICDGSRICGESGIPCGSVTVFTFTSGLPGTRSGERSESNNL